MLKGITAIATKNKAVVLTAICFLICIGLILFSVKIFTKDTSIPSDVQNSKYVILAANDMGMHCYQLDYSQFLILPPGNNLKVQIFYNDGETAELVNSGIKVKYQIIDNTTSADKTNFWEYAAYYGYDIPLNIGVIGNGLSGEMKLSDDRNYYEATAIPVTAYNDGNLELNPYQLAAIQVYDAVTGQKLAAINDVVVPVSDEMECGICHGIANTDLNILLSHDKLSNTQLADELALGKRYKCSDCHQDNVLDMPGNPEILPLSQAIHGFHADKMTLSTIEPNCYSCHPGPVTQCYRGVMSSEVGCINPACHGDMENVAKSQANGRQAWLQEPDCGNCHGAQYGVNPDLLFRNSFLINNEDSEMNGIIQCISCHNSAHAEWKSNNTIDNLLPKRLLGYSSFINRCTVCHEGAGIIHKKAED